jgi:superfamily II DNA or RNA helicase
LKTLRPYQETSINLIRDAIKKGNKRILLAIATGAGKSVIARAIVEMAGKKNNKVLFTAHRTILINQMRETFIGLDNVTCGTLQSLSKQEHNDVSIVIEDEAHYGNGSKMRSKMPKNVITIGLSATPLNGDGSKLEGWDIIIDQIQLCDLIEMGYASKVKCLAPIKVERGGLKTTKGDYDINASFALMSKSSLISDIVKTYEKHALGLKTLVFCVNIEHAEMLAAEFKASGHKCDSVHSKKDSDEVMQKFKNNEIDIVCNVEQLTTGYDSPDIYCILLAAPTKSIVKAVQIYGRATRLNPADVNKMALILDCAGVIEDTIHPLTRMRFDRERKEKKEKKCERITMSREKCGGSFFVDSTTRVPADDGYEKVTTIKKCKRCNAIQISEALEIVKITECVKCGFILDNKMQIQKTNTELKFTLICKNCGEEQDYRTIELTDGELVEIQNIEKSWSDVEFELRSAKGRDGKKYHYMWSSHAIQIFKSCDFSPAFVLEQIANYNSKNIPLGSLPFYLEKLKHV